jgi:uncharacterized surface protein with fasciclin (FAS1) repeats
MFTLLRALVISLVVVHAFQVKSRSFHRPSLLLAATQDTREVEGFLAQNYPTFMSLLSTNEKVWKTLRETGGGFTIFVANSEAFEKLGEKKRMQLADPRNGEATEKIATYHVIGEPVTAEELFASGGVITLGGEIPVGRSTSGGFFGIGGKEDGGVTINGATLVGSIYIGDCIVHEVDSLVSPQIIWRYMDQLRIPGSR